MMQERFLRIKLVKKESKSVADQGVKLSLEAAGKLGRCVKFITEHVNLLEKESSSLAAMKDAVAETVGGFPSVKKLLNSPLKWKRVEDLKREAEVQVVKAIGFMNLWGMKTRVLNVANIKNSALSTTSMYINCMGDVQGILSSIGVDALLMKYLNGRMKK